MKKRTLSVVDLFAGSGGLSLGLELAGFTPIYVNELNTDARGTYILNRKDRYEWFSEDLDSETWLNPFSSSDIRRITRKEHLTGLQQIFRAAFGIAEGEIDLVVGGPPCQGFSNIGYRRSYAVAKEDLPSNHLYKDMARVVDRLRPKAFVFENVRGLLTGKWTNDGQNGEIWEAVKRAFIGIADYKIAAELVYAKNYGVAQNRPRILLIGVRQDIAGEFTHREHISEIDGTAITQKFLPQGNPNSAPSLAELLGDLIDPDHINGGKTLRYPSRVLCDVQRELRTCVTGLKIRAKGDPITEHEYSHHKPEVIKRFAAMRSGQRYQATKKFSQRVLPSSWGDKGPSITATSLPDDYVHFLQNRTLTVREWARLQGFPDWYQFNGKRTTGGIRRAGNPIAGVFERELPKYTQIGNAVPVPLAKAIGTRLAEIIREHDRKNAP